MPLNEQEATERTALLYHVSNDRRVSELQHQQDAEAQSIISSTVTKEEQALGSSPVGERLPYNDYTTIDWLHDLVKDSTRFGHIHSRKGLRHRAISLFDTCSSWIAVIFIGAITACIAYIVDIAVITVSDWKSGYCTTNPFLSRESCCPRHPPLPSPPCAEFHLWAQTYTSAYATYVVIALVFGIISSTVTLLTKSTLPTPSLDPNQNSNQSEPRPHPQGKTMYMASGSGIPELKTLLSGFVIPSFLSFRVLLVKALGATFAVATGMCLGKEGPFVHISTCVGYLVGRALPGSPRENGRAMRELLSAACASGLSVAFGAPIGGVLFSYEEVSSFFPRGVLWRAFLCSAVAAGVLRELNPMGTGKLVLFEVEYGGGYGVGAYVIFLGLGVAGGVFGGLFCGMNYLWARWFRGFGVVRRNPVLEVGVVGVVTAVVQYVNPLTREPGDVVLKNLLVDCGKRDVARESWVCQNEMAEGGVSWSYLGYLLHGTLTKLILTTITFGIKVPSGVIIPALDAGAFFGRLVGLFIPSISPGLCALVGAAAFLAGVSRMTISLAVITLELTGSLPLSLPAILAILTAKSTADTLSTSSIYDVAQTLLSHPFLDPDASLALIRGRNLLVEELLPPERTMAEITVGLGPGETSVGAGVLKGKLEMLKARGLMDAGVVIVRGGMVQGYVGQGELEFAMGEVVPAGECMVRVVEGRGGGEGEGEREGEEEGRAEGLVVDLVPFVDRTPLCICARAPMEYAVEMFCKLGLKYLCVTEEGSGVLVGVIIKKRLVGYLEKLKDGE